MVDTGNMSIQASIKRLRSSENLPIHLTISILPLLARVNFKKKTPGKHTLSSIDEVVSHSIPEILDSIFCSQRIVNFCISYKICSSVLVLIFLLQAL